MILEGKTKIVYHLMREGTTIEDICKEAKCTHKEATDMVKEIAQFYHIEKRFRHTKPTLIRTDGKWKSQRQPITGIAAHDPFRLAQRSRVVR